MKLDPKAKKDDMDKTATDEQQAGPPLGLSLHDGLGPLPERWYVIDRDGLATLCKDADDAQDVAAAAWVQWPRRGPYRVALLGDVAAERERWANALQSIMCSPVGVQARDKLATGQSANTPGGRAWLAALKMLDLGPNDSFSGQQQPAQKGANE